MLTNYLYSVEQSPSWEANRSSASEEIPCFLSNSTVHRRVDKSPSPFLSRFGSIHCTPYNPVSWISILLHLRLGFIWSVSFRFPEQNLARTIIFSHNVPHAQRISCYCDSDRENKTCKLTFGGPLTGDRLNEHANLGK